MKIKNVLLTLGLALGLGVSAVAGLSATQDVKAADAVTIPAETKFYLTPSAYWNQSNARFAIYFFGNGDGWVSMTKVAGETNLYEATSPTKTFSKLIFCRMNPSAAANNWNNKWNQTADLTYDGTNNWYTVKENTWDKGGGTWSKYAPGEEQKEYTVEEYVVVDGEIVGEKTTLTLTTDTYEPELKSTEDRTAIGVYTDLAKTTKYEGKLVEDVTNTLYLHYESVTEFDYIYVSSFDTAKWGKEVKEFSVYTWSDSGETYGTWPGKTFKVNESAAEGTNFNGQGLLRIPFNPQTKATGVVISVEGGKQTQDLTFTLKNYYDINAHIKTADGQKYAGESTTVGLQAELAFKVAEAIKTAGSHKYGETTYEHSICALDGAVITSILTGYSALTDTAKFDAATFWTNNVDGRKDGLGEVQASGDYTGLEVITTLTRLQTSATGSNLIIKMTMENNSSMLVIIIAAAVAVSALGVYLIIRRRKNEK